MTFEKTNYWERRSEGKRGQGDSVAASHTTSTRTTFLQNREQSRRKFVDHRLTSKTARIRSDKEAEARRTRVARVEAGEQERIEKKRKEAEARYLQEVIK